MNAAGTLGFAPDFRAPVPWDSFGAFVTNPISMRARKPATKPALIEYPGGFLIHTGLPNPGLRAVIKKYSRRWADSRLPIIVHLMADHPDETSRMVQDLEELENIAAVELSYAPLETDTIILKTIEMASGELPLIINLQIDQILSLGPRVMQAGAAAISMGAIRGMLMLKNGQQVTGRVGGAGLYPQALLILRDAVQAKISIIGAGAVVSKEYADAMLSMGAMAVQIDTGLWKGDFNL